MSLHLIAASITCYLGNGERSMLRIRAENGRPLGGVKWPALLFWLPPGGIGLNIDMQHYKTRLLSGCTVTASCLSLPIDAHARTLANTHAHMACTHIMKSMKCSILRWLYPLWWLRDVYHSCFFFCFHHVSLFLPLFSFFFHLQKISIKPSLFSLCLSLHRHPLCVHNVILRCNDISDFSNVDGRFISVSIIHLWAPWFKNIFFPW